MVLDGAEECDRAVHGPGNAGGNDVSLPAPFYSPRILLLWLVESMPRLAPLDEEAPLRFRSFANLALRILTPDGGQRDRA